MSLAEFLSDTSPPKKRKAFDPPALNKVRKVEGPDLRTPWNSGESSFVIKQNGKGIISVEHAIGGQTYPWCSAAVVSSSNTLRSLTSREFDSKMKVNFRACKHPLLNAEREKEMFDFIKFI